ncbi:uncharacterized protein LOC115719026 isoform X2 [Cannabis sativa]|uniref:uncharacterized protein LOC115719026 isoform X2 n=1 Tax=Cannabis sativa TaxID=3483 RepID=UPI0029CA079A|nr:uncharacterized protein LOC115719026 isoform X2 [Cannabis sativa]
MQSPLKMTSPPCNPPESNISNLRKSGSSANPVSELRPPLASRSSLEKVRDCSLERNVKPSFSSSESPVLVSSNPTLHGVVESNSQVTNRQMENIVQCNDASYKVTNPTLHGVESNSQELDGFVGVDELCPGQAGPPTTAIKISIEDAELQTNEGNLLLKETSQMGKCEIDAKVIDSSQESSELEISQLKTRSSSAIEVTGPSLKSDISDHQLVEERPFDLSLKDHKVILQANPVCKANETFGEQTETMHSGPFFSDDQMLQDNAADNSSHVEDYDVAVTENSHAYPHFGSIELEKEDHDVSPELKSQKGDINEPYGKQTEMMNSLNYIATPIVSDSQMLLDNAADITSKVQGYNAAGIENFPAFSHIGFEEQEKELVKPVAEEAEPYPISSEMSWDNPANISSKVQDYNRAELEHGNEDFTAIGELRKQLKVEEGDMQSSNRTDRYNNISVSISANNDHKMVFDNVIEKQDGQIHLTREDTLQCHLLEDRSSLLVEDIIPMVANCDLNSHAQHEVGFHDQSTSVEFGNMEEGDRAGAVDAEDVNASCQKVGTFANSEVENTYVTCEPSFAVQVKSEHSSKNKIEHVDLEVKNNLSVESSHCSFDSQPGDELCPCDDNSSSMVQMYMLEGENDDNAKGDQVEQITPYQCETKEICNDEEESTKAPTLSFDNSHSLEEPQILENESNTRVPLHTDMAQTFKESEGGNLVIEEQDDNCELQNPVNQIEEVSSASVPQDEDATEEHCSKESGINTKQDVLVIKPPFEAAGEEILTMKSDAVQNSPDEMGGHDS